jgi:hypothetical protein
MLKVMMILVYLVNIVLNGNHGKKNFYMVKIEKLSNKYIEIIVIY